MSSNSSTNSKDPSKPVVSLVVLCFNQEKFVREAVESCLAQTYQPLEIVLSDDCSRDRTFGIIQEIVSSYQGPHKIILNRNENNTGIGEHVNRAIALSTGEIIVGAAGDDISLPERVSKLVPAIANGAMIAYSSSIKIDEIGKIIGTESVKPDPGNERSILNRVANCCPGVVGATSSYNRKVFETFGPLLPTTIAEDRALAFRAYALGQVVFIDEPLVKYRFHSQNIWSVRAQFSTDELRKTLKKRARIRHLSYLQFEHDLNNPIFSNLTSRELSAARQMCKQRILEAKIEEQIMSSKQSDRWRGLFNALRNSIDHKFRLKVMVTVLFPPLYFGKLKRF